MSKRLTENKPSDTPVTAARPVKNTDPLPRRIASWLGLLLLIAFPGVTYFIEPRFGVAASACLLILATLLRILYKPNALTGIMAMVTAILGILVALSQSLLMLKFWPVLAVILVILALFIGLGKDDGMVAKAVAGPEGAKTDPQESLLRLDRALCVARRGCRADLLLGQSQVMGFLEWRCRLVCHPDFLWHGASRPGLYSSGSRAPGGKEPRDAAADAAEVKRFSSDGRMPPEFRASQAPDATARPEPFLKARSPASSRP